MADFEVHIEGLEELEQKLQQLAPDIAKRAVRKSVRAGIEVFQEAISENAPRHTGHLAESINIKLSVTGGDRDDTTGGIIGITGPSKDAFYGVFQEYGTAREPAQPFVAPAYEENKDKVVEVFVETLKDELERLTD